MRKGKILSTQAKKKAGGIITEVAPSVKDYTSFYSKSKSYEMKIITSWNGARYLGIVGKSGESPETVIDPETGETVYAQSEPDDEEILKIVSDSLVQRDNENKQQIAQIEDSDIRQQAMDADSVNVEDQIYTLQKTMDLVHEERDAYWALVSEYSDSISSITDDQIIDKSSKGLFSWIRRIFSFKNDSPKYIEKYRSNLLYRPSTSSGTYWCGPWAMDWIYNSNFHKQKYDFFESYTVEIFGSRPMIPLQMTISMTIASTKAGKLIRVSPFWSVGHLDCYYHVRDGKGPILINTEWFSHWIVAYGTKTTGTYLWRNYYYAVSDNGHSVKDGTYESPHWYKAAWFIIYVNVYD